MVEPKELKPGDVLGRYQLLMPIAKGGMGQVWAARQNGSRGFQKLVAVKTIIATDEDAGQLEEMLFEEASLASQIRHNNVAQTLDLGEQDATLYLVMEWVDGEPLDFIMRTARTVGGVPIAVCAHLIIQACKGLHAAHEAKSSRGEPLGIVHRDISPQNLLVTYSGVVKLVDFGVAKATQRSTQPTAFGEVKGKFAYMSPEQVSGQPVDARSDVFAMGIVLYRLTTGRHPFKSDTPAATIHNILTTGPALPSEIVPNFPAALEQVVMKALARNRADRFTTAHELWLAIEQSLPSTVMAHAEKNTQTFLRQLFEKRMAERHDTLQLALKAASEGSAAVSTSIRAIFPGSQSTMRAVSVEAASTPSPSQGRMMVAEDAVARPTVPPSRALRLSGYALAAGLMVAAGVIALRNGQRTVAAAGGSGPFVSEAAPVAPASPVAPAAPVVSAAPNESPPASATAGSEASVPSEVGSATTAPAVPPKKRDRAIVHREVPNVVAPQAAASEAPLPRPAPRIEPQTEIDPLNRRR